MKCKECIHWVLSEESAQQESCYGICHLEPQAIQKYINSFCHHWKGRERKNEPAG